MCVKEGERRVKGVRGCLRSGSGGGGENEGVEFIKNVEVNYVFIGYLGII